MSRRITILALILVAAPLSAQPPSPAPPAAAVAATSAVPAPRTLIEVPYQQFKLANGLARLG